MTYSEYRKQFATEKEFENAFGQLSYEEAFALIASDNAPTHVKACMIDTWRKANEKVEKG